MVGIRWWFCLLVALSLTNVRARAADSVLVFNEIQYHPADLGSTEWVELRNLHGVDVDISGWSLGGGVEYTFPANTIVPGGGYVVVAAIPGQIPGAKGPWTGLLNNGGDNIRLLNRNGRIMDEVSYNNGGEWPTGADGSGATLARRSPSAASDPDAWTTSITIGGTPGGQNFYEGATAVRTRLIAVGDPWRYEDSGLPAPVGWQSRTFDDSNWKSGSTLIAGGGGKLNRATLKPSDLSSGLLAYWSFDETSGTVAANGVAGGLNGTMVNGAAFASDTTRGRVAAFDGLDDRMEVIDPASSLPSTTFLPMMTGSNDFTWAAWVWSSTASTLSDQFGSVILGNRSDPNGQDTSPREFIKIMPTAMQYHRNAATENLDYDDLPTSAWTHMCVVKRGLNLDYYANGVFTVTRSLTGGLSNPLPFFVGGDRRTTGGSPEHFQGRVDDVGLWTRALSPAEVAQIGTPPPAPQLPSPPEQTTNAATGPEPRYFRKSFSFSGTPSSAALELWPAADDGAIIYLNGAEVWRSNVPPTAEVTDATFTPAPVSISNSALVNGSNVLSAEVHQFPGGNNDLLFGAELVITSVPGPSPAPPASLLFNEISGSSDGGFFIELKNTSAVAVDTAGWTLKTSTGLSFSLPSQSVAPGGYSTFTAASLGLIPADGMRLFLFAPGASELRDSRAIDKHLSGFLPSGRWGAPSTPTPGAGNIVALNDAVVINEIYYHAPGTSPEQWIELYNKSASSVDLSEWRFTEGINLTFSSGTVLGPGQYLVVAWDPAAFAALHPGVTALGPWTGNLSGKGEVIRLRDFNGNVADEVAYFDSGRWSRWADGGGSSLELIDSRSDNSKAESWDASDESTHSTWQNASFTASGANVGNDPTSWSELVMGLLDSGECLVDDISVREDPAGTNLELIQNGSFGGGTADKWRIIGTHRASTVVDDPNAPGNKVLKLVANGTTEHMNNHAETTLKRGTAVLGANGIDSTKQYRISFRAKWLRGTNRLHARLYFNRVAFQTLLNRPTTGGTPGLPNSRAIPNAGPTFEALLHTPTVPAVGQAANVTVKVSDPDSVASAQLFTSVNGAAFSSSSMTVADGVYAGTIPGQSSGAVVQFYIRAVDGLGAVSVYPATGPASRAMIPWADGRAALTLPTGVHPHNVRILISPADATDLYKLENVMSNEEHPCTVILDEREVYYQAFVRLKSSEHGRYQENRVGYKLSFGGDEKFLGAHEDVTLDRSGGVVSGQKEILIKAVSNVAGGIYATEDDIARVIPPVAPAGNGVAFTGVSVLGPAIFSKSRFDDEYLDAQWSDGGSGPVFKYELHYPLTQTIDPVTRVVGTLPENPKIPQDSTGPSGVPVANIGADKELYRWHWLIRNARSNDDYTKLIAAVSAVGQASTSVFQAQTVQNLEVSTWLRACCPAALFGVIDNYTGDGSRHNALLYFPPGGKGVLIPWDLDFLNQGNSQGSLVAGGDLAKWLAIPVNKRTYYGHLQDILNRSFNTAFLTRWAQHYSKFGTDDLTSSLPYLNARAQYARDVINGTNGQISPIPSVPFRITTPSPANSSTPFLTIVGDAWIDVVEIRLAGSSIPLPVTWTDADSWSLPLPVSAGSNTYTLQAYNTSGAVVGSASIVVNGTGGVFPASAGSLVVSELNYNPPGSDDATEFIELLNITGAVLDLGGCHFDDDSGQGIAYTFPAGVQIAAGGRIIVVRDRAAFAAAYPTAGPLAPGQYSGLLDNSGETIVLYAASGAEIFRFTYSDSVQGTDGDGRTLVRILNSSNPNAQSDLWRASTTNGGNPGGSDSVSFTALANADNDADGILALLEYMFGTSDAVVDVPPPYSIAFDDSGNCYLNVRRAINADDSFLTFESSTDLDQGWQPANPTRLSSVVTGTIAEETWIVAPPANASSFYLRLKATVR